MTTVYEFVQNNWPNILTVVVLFLTLLTAFKMMNVNFTSIEDKGIKKVVTFESFESRADPETVMKISRTDPAGLHSTCTSISKKSCGVASYCVLINGEQCVGGNSNGPTYLTKDGAKVDYQYYMHQGKCFGKNCPPEVK
jgi:hypothetical protein